MPKSNDNEATNVLGPTGHGPEMMAFKPRGERGPTVYRDMSGVAPEHLARMGQIPGLAAAHFSNERPSTSDCPTCVSRNAIPSPILGQPIEPRNSHTRGQERDFAVGWPRTNGRENAGIGAPVTLGDTVRMLRPNASRNVAALRNEITIKPQPTFLRKPKLPGRPLSEEEKRQYDKEYKDYFKVDRNLKCGDSMTVQFTETKPIGKVVRMISVEVVGNPNEEQLKAMRQQLYAKAKAALEEEIGDDSESGYSQKIAADYEQNPPPEFFAALDMEVAELCKSFACVKPCDGPHCEPQSWHIHSVRLQQSIDIPYLGGKKAHPTDPEAARRDPENYKYDGGYVMFAILIVGLEVRYTVYFTVKCLPLPPSGPEEESY